MPENLLGLLPEGFELREAVTLRNNFVTVFHALTADLGLRLPWPKPEGFVPERADEAILIWGGSSSVGQYALQVLKYYGYRYLLATASKRNHALLRENGATSIFDYSGADVIAKIAESAGKGVALVLDSVGSKTGSVVPTTDSRFERRLFLLYSRFRL